MKTHDLKTHPGPFTATVMGLKQFEFRKDDRGFEVGDVLVLREWDPSWDPTPSYTGDTATRRVSYILRGPDYGVPEGYVVMGLVLT